MSVSAETDHPVFPNCPDCGHQYIQTHDLKTGEKEKRGFCASCGFYEGDTEAMKQPFFGIPLQGW